MTYVIQYVTRRVIVMKKRVTYYLPEEVYGMLRFMSYEDEKTMSMFVERLIVEEFKRRYPNNVIGR